MNLDPDFAAEALQYVMNLVKNGAWLECVKNNTLKKEAFNKSQSLLKNVRFNPTDITETLNPGIVSLT